MADQDRVPGEERPGRVGYWAVVVTIAIAGACNAGTSSPPSTEVASSTASANPTASPATTTTTAALGPEAGDPALLAGDWLITYTGVEQYPEQLFFTWQPGDRWGLWRWNLEPTCPEVGCAVALTITDLLYGPSEESFPIGEFAYSDGIWAFRGPQDFSGACLPSDAADWSNDDYWHFDAFAGSELELIVNPIDHVLVGGSWTSSSLEVTRTVTGIYTPEAAAACDVPVFSRSVASAIPFTPEAISILPEPSAAQIDVLAVSHEVGDGGSAISLLDLSQGDYAQASDLGVAVENGTYPEWSPDGTMLAYTFFPDSGPPEVWVASGDGSDPRYLAAGYEPIWSPDGSMIIVRRDGERSGWTDLYAVLLPGGQVEQATFRGWAGNSFWFEAGRLAVHDPAQFSYWTMRWEPYEGFSSDSETPLIVDVVGEAHRASDVLFYAAANEASPEYGSPRVAVADLTGSETMRVNWQLPRPDAEWAVAPDGSFVAVPHPGGIDLTSVVAGGDHFTYVESTYPNSQAVAWSPAR